jgi:hypothetical protein
MDRLTLACALLVGAAGCQKPASAPLCGLHSAAAPVFLVGKEKKAISVGSSLGSEDLIAASGPALLECFGGALKVLEAGDEVKVGKLVEASVTGATLPEQAVQNGEVVDLPWSKRIVAARYINPSFTPLTANQGPSAPSNAENLKAFFTPNGIEKLQNAPAPDGPRNLPAPPNRPYVPHVHAGELGQGGLVAKIEDGSVFAETDDLATAVLLEGRTIELGRTVRLVLPKGAEVRLTLSSGKQLSLEGPADVRLR